MTREELIDALVEVYDAHYSPSALSGGGTPLSKVTKAVGHGVKAVKKEIGGPVKSVNRALKYRKASKSASSPERATQMMRRANAVLKNRGATIAAAAAGATAGVAVPIPGTGEIASVAAAKGANKVLKRVRARHVARNA